MTYGYARVSTKTQDIRRQTNNIEAYCQDTHMGSVIIYQEAHTGAEIEGRKELDKLLKVVQTGDTIIFDSASRMSRNTEEAMELYENLFNQGVNLIFLKEPYINTETYRKSLENQIQIHTQTGDIATDKFLTAIIEALNEYTVALAKEQIKKVFAQAQKELEDIRSRVSEGMQKQIAINENLKALFPDTYRQHKDYKQIGSDKEASYETKKAQEIKPKIIKKSKSFEGTMNDLELSRYLGISRTTVIKYKKEIEEARLKEEQEAQTQTPKKKEKKA